MRYFFIFLPRNEAAKGCLLRCSPNPIVPVTRKLYHAVPQHHERVQTVEQMNRAWVVERDAHGITLRAAPSCYSSY
jgi:hypothetical protein